MKKKKIAICHSQVPFVSGGAEIHVEQLYLNLRQRNFDVDIIKIPFKWYPKEEILKHAFLWRMLDLTESNGEEIDLVIGTKFPSYGIQHPNKVTWLIHQFRQVYDLYGTEYSDFKGTPEDIAIKTGISQFDNVALSESKKIYTNAQNTKNRLKKFNGIDSEVLYHPPKHVGKYYNENEEPYILSVGRLDKLKRIDLLIQAMRYTDTKVKCVIGGKGPEETYLKELVEKYNLHDRVKFLGFVEDEELLRLYANCLGVYYAPLDEDYGYITLEAFLSKKPVITCFDSGGVLEFVKNDVNGYICDVNSEIIAAKINCLINNSTIKIKEFGQNGYDMVKNITWDNVVDELTATLK
ncbi:hypothetical protein CD30_13800 [Ureibacillus massiliensis 4400831 = CIP 108448 = CCUG 49529]|uniref:Glycosyl transferase family 1 domain-containing protein n=1 Tax=Ureibacillus massiliensis 4400831 = CIP 108448 = CCUG 49529 TaxID=1211035 RepID=A0A0A3IZ44_9BACL|nr:glycosyltransferase family 4 protein [Ureibacillus massiliensis]KGR90044.1 hypothetical protein CD30_13800 [Ureibacillus massiliensis 4400831 = CIP 108448 = CCUG 49529]